MHGSRRNCTADQTSVAPPTFLLFCSDPKAVQASYRRYLENKLREAFDLRGTPVKIRLRSRGEGREVDAGKHRSGTRG